MSSHVARLWRREIHIGFCWESQKERDYEEDLYIRGGKYKNEL
jgi:hypothetical protein